MPARGTEAAGMGWATNSQRGGDAALIGHCTAPVAPASPLPLHLPLPLPLSPAIRAATLALGEQEQMQGLRCCR